MSNDITVSINGRRAIPVRAIPWVTAWVLSPDELAKQLARQIHPAFGKLQNTFAYHLENGSPQQILPKQWDDIIAHLTALEARLREQHGNENIGYSDWLKQSVAELPPGIFLWFDEFQADKPFGKKTMGWERDQVLVLTPIWSEQQRMKVFEGFEGCIEVMPTGEANTISDDSKAASAASKLLSEPGEESIGLQTVPAESLPPSEALAERRKNHDIAKERGCRRLILEYWDDIEKLHGPMADGRNARNVILKKLDESDSKPQLKTFRNKLRQLRNEKLIP